MARYAILNTVEWESCRALASGELSDEEVMERLSGCAWLFRIEDGVDDVGEAARRAVREHFSSAEGRRALALEEEEGAQLRWETAMRWLPDESWQRHGLVPIRHPDVERVILDAGEELGAELRGGG